MRLAACWALPSEVCGEDCWFHSVLQYIFFCLTTYGWVRLISHLNPHFRGFADPKIHPKYLKSNMSRSNSKTNNKAIDQQGFRAQKNAQTNHGVESRIDRVQHMHDNSLTVPSSDPAGLPLFCSSSVVCSNNRSVNHICPILLIIEIILVIIPFLQTSSTRLWGNSYRGLR